MPISRFMRGIFNLRPPKVRNNVTWDVAAVLRKLQTFSPVRNLSLKQLTLKLVTLLALLAGMRVQSLHLIDVRNVVANKNLVKIRFGDLLKQTRPNYQQQELCFKGYAPNRGICVCVVMCEYLERTKSLRKDSTSLLLSFVKPHKPVTKDTIARWLKTMLEMSGIDTSIFTPHSIRAAATSTAKDRGVQMNTIIQTAGWANAKTFAVYYEKPIHGGHEGFARQIQDRIKKK